MIAVTRMEAASITNSIIDASTALPPRRRDAARLALKPSWSNVSAVPGKIAVNDTRLIISWLGTTGGWGGGGDGGGIEGGGEGHWPSKMLTRHVSGGRSGGGAQRRSAAPQLPGGGPAGGAQSASAALPHPEGEGEAAGGEQSASMPQLGGAGGGGDFVQRPGQTSSSF